MWVRLSQFEEPAALDIAQGQARLTHRKTSEIPMTDTPARIDAIYRYPVKGLSPQPLRAHEPDGRGDAARRPALRHRERPLRVRPGGARLFPQAALPDADAQRAAGRVAHRLRRGKPYADHPLGGPARRRAATCAPRKAGWRSKPSSAASCPTICAGRPRCCHRRRPQLFRRGQEGRLHHQPRLGGGGRDGGGQRRSIRCASAAMSMSRAGRPGTNSTCVGATIAHRRQRAAQGGQAHRALRGHRRRSRHRHSRPADPAHAACRASVTPIAASMPR